MTLSLIDRQRYAQIVAQVLVIDYAITLEEDVFFDRLVARLALTDEQRQAVVKSVNIGDKIELAVAKLSDEARQDLMKVLAEAAASDGHVAARELDVIERVGAVLRIQAAHPGLR
ncbi:MAG: TerB family tellurite resistance protein [Myxococcales bacterium]|nr:TerB family tellurite resistance protein [Myxococcales bacterium]